MSLRERWTAWRNARLKNPEFQRFCADFPLTRGIARTSAARIFDLVAGFVYAQTLQALVQMRAFVLLAERPHDAQALATASALPLDAVERVLRASVALRLIEPLGDGRYTLAADGAALIGQPGLLDMIRHHAGFYRDLADPLALMRAGRGAHLSAYWPYATGSDDANAAAVADYSALMAATQPAVSAEILAAFSMRGRRALLDLGGGEGAFLEAAGRRWPHLRLHLLDLPSVLERARTRLAPIQDRVSFHPGSFLTDPLPGGADVITLVRVLHDQDEAGAERILKAAHAAAAPGTRILIAEPMSGAPRPDRLSDAYFSFYFMAMGRGETRTPARIRAMLTAAGWHRTRMLHTRMPSLLRIIVAEAGAKKT